MILFNLYIICINIKFDFHLQKREEKEIITHFRFAIDFHHFNYTQKTLWQLVSAATRKIK